MPYVASTLSADNCYTDFNKENSAGARIARPATPRFSVLIKGGANVANKLTTPEGVITGVTDEQAEFLKSNKLFQLHQKNGHVKIFERSVAPEKAAKDMTDRDKAAPLNEEKGDFEDGGRAAGVAPVNAKIE